MQEYIVGRIQNTHGLIGVMKIKMYYPYTDEILVKSNIILQDQEFKIEKVFGKIKDNCLIKIKGIDDIEKSRKYKNESLIALIREEDFYSFHLIGYIVFRDNVRIGLIQDIQWINGMEFLDLETEMITIDQIKEVKNNQVYL